MRRVLRIILWSIAILAALLLAGTAWFYLEVRMPDPLTDGDRIAMPPVEANSDGRQHVGRNWIGKNQHGLWEIYVEGDDLQRGLAYAALAGDLVRRQEEIFVGRIRRLVPDEGRLKYLKYFVAWFDRGLDEHVPLEFRREIFGVSRAMADGYDFVGPKYHRALNYHAAHDIGHALQDLAMVGCTSFAAWGDRTTDGGLLVARNFDFSVGEDFACEKLITFVAPSDGHPFMTVAWGGFMGAVSAMNLEGLTVTINAARSKVPYGAKTPISLVARDIVQYAATLDEAITIAERHEVFVSESILVSSARDGRAVIIEKAPDAMDVFTPEGDLLICANHYQSERFKDTEENQANIRESDSMARYKRMGQLTSAAGPMDPTTAARILRDRSGPDGNDIGMGDPVSINQLLAHHAVIFQPEKRLAWVSTGPYQIGEFICYDLNDVFERSASGIQAGAAYVDSLTIPQDPFLASEAMTDFVLYREVRAMITDHVMAGEAFHLADREQALFINSNPYSYLTYLALADMHRNNGDLKKASTLYSMALSYPVSSLMERARIEEKLKACATN